MKQYIVLIAFFGLALALSWGLLLFSDPPLPPHKPQHNYWLPSDTISDTIPQIED